MINVILAFVLLAYLCYLLGRWAGNKLEGDTEEDFRKKCCDAGLEYIYDIYNLLDHDCFWDASIRALDDSSQVCVLTSKRAKLNNAPITIDATISGRDVGCFYVSGKHIRNLLDASSYLAFRKKVEKLVIKKRIEKRAENKVTFV